jgi:hypothetical protein
MMLHNARNLHGTHQGGNVQIILIGRTDSYERFIVNATTRLKTNCRRAAEDGLFGTGFLAAATNDR